MLRALLLFALTGALAMSDSAVADEKKDPAKKDNYEANATVKKWDGKKFLKAIPNQLALKGEISGKMVIYTRPEADNVKTPKGSEITIGDETFVVEKVTPGDVYHINYVTLKPKDK